MSSKEIIYEELLQTNVPKGKTFKRLIKALHKGGFPKGNVFDLTSETKSPKIEFPCRIYDSSLHPKLFSLSCPL